MRASEARKACPELVTVMVPTRGAKADLDVYKKAGERVVEVLCEFASIVEKRSVDEVAIDVTAEAAASADAALSALACSHLADSDDSLSLARLSQDAQRRGDALQRFRRNDDGDPALEKSAERLLSGYERMLLGGAVVVSRARAAVRERLGFTCSGGVAPTKMLAKLAAGLHKPDQQTVVLPRAVAALLRDLPLDRLSGLGGDLGRRVMRELGATTAGDVVALEPEAWRASTFDSGERAWIVSVCEGTFVDPVKPRATYKSFASSKTFYHRPLASVEACESWLSSFANELWKRVEDDRAARQRAPTNVTISVFAEKHATRTERISVGWGGSAADLERAGLRLLRRWARSVSGSWQVTALGLAVSNFQDLPKGTKPITGFFAAAAEENPSALQESRAGAPTDGDEVFLAALPSENQAELRAPPSSCGKTGCAAPEVDDDVFSALPPEIQAELRDDRKRRLLLGGGGGCAAKKPAGTIRAYLRVGGDDGHPPRASSADDR